MGRRANSFFLSWMPVSASWHCPRALTDFCPPGSVCVTSFAASAGPLLLLEEEVQPWTASWCSGRGFLAQQVALLGKVLARWFQASTTWCVQCIPRKCMHPCCAHTVGLWDSASSFSPARSLQLSVSCCGRPRGRPGPVSADAHLGVDCQSLLVARPISQ